jgi:hypothetical protein
MNRALWFVIPITLAALVGAAMAAEQKQARNPKPIRLDDHVQVKATVEAIDYANRTVTLKGPKGEMTTLEVDPSVDRFDKIQVGDQVTADYYESVVVQVHKPGEAPPAPASTKEKTQRMEGTKPAGASAVEETMTVTVEAIDRSIPAVTVRTEDGDDVSFRVRDKKNLEHVEVGDKVVITRTAGLMIKVESPH